MDILESVKLLAGPILEEAGVELVELIYKRERGAMVLRLLVDKPGGISLDECAKINERLSEILDKEDIIPDIYALEISSPGLDRPLKNRRDFERAIGRMVRIVDSSGKNYAGKIIGITAQDGLVLEDAKGISELIPLANIAVAKIEIEF